MSWDHRLLLRTPSRHSAPISGMLASAAGSLSLSLQNAPEFHSIPFPKWRTATAAFRSETLPPYWTPSAFSPSSLLLHLRMMMRVSWWKRRIFPGESVRKRSLPSPPDFIQRRKKIRINSSLFTTFIPFPLWSRSNSGAGKSVPRPPPERFWSENFSSLWIRKEMNWNQIPMNLIMDH